MAAITSSKGSSRFTSALCISVLAAISCALATAQRLPFAPPTPGVKFTDDELLQIGLNLEYLEGEFFINSAFGYGLEGINASLTGGGPKSRGGRKAALSPQIYQLAEMFALQEVGHVRAFREYLGNHAFPRPKIDIGRAFSDFFANASGGILRPPFDPYFDDINWLLAAYTLPYVGLTSYVGNAPLLEAKGAKALNAGVLGLESGQDAVIRTTLWWMRSMPVFPYLRTADYFTGILSALRDRLDGSGTLDDENIVVAPAEGAEGRTSTNVLSANMDSLYYARNAAQTLSIVYGTGSPSIPGGFFPEGANGAIPAYYLKNPSDATGQRVT